MTDSLSLEALRRGFLERALGVSWLRGRNLCMAFLALTFAKEQPERLQQFLFLSKNLPTRSCTTKVSGSLVLTSCPLAAQGFFHFLWSDYPSFFPPAGISKLYLRERETRGELSISFLSSLETYTF